MKRSTLSSDEKAAARAELRHHQWLAFSLVLPLLCFLLFSFIAPISTLLLRSVYHPNVQQLIPHTIALLNEWDGHDLPNNNLMIQMAIELKKLAKQREAGELAQEINRNLAGSASQIKITARQLRQIDDAILMHKGQTYLQDAHPAWRDKAIWFAIKKAGQVFTDQYYLTALDLEKNAQGKIQSRQDINLYIALFLKTLKMAFIVTGLTLILGYPLAYYLASAPARTANVLFIFVLLPFWTSILVRTTAWIALLQTNGVINASLLWLDIIKQPLPLLYNQFSTIIVMTHILLPLMILPLYAVMKSIDPCYVRAAGSLGAKPVRIFLTVYFPMTLSGLSAGILLVFILFIGYFITPALVGGTDGQLISNIIAFHMQKSNNWALASALGALLLLFIIVLYWLFDRLTDPNKLKLV
ncbi:ABC transporter permease [Shewanella surugensis]|uniref:ABC transporter permease n=1 Tax=Shewanella surugensis TaxID=212020 RepID=A0ABT0LCP1_9GAMM|nr:ABC transporter permease [Shewanella surugensis]MCL1125471.1 ABC transporter permease [Shewanella surugensis]